jgi:GNAT superfamily N-acetyltransferase
MAEQVPPRIEIWSMDGCAARWLIAALVAQCSPQSLRARLFLAEGRVLPENLVQLLAGPPGGRVYLAMDNRAVHRPVGLANLARDAGEVEVEAGLLVADRWRRRGIGRALLLHALADPRWAGVPVRASVQADNVPILRMLRSLDAPPRLVDTAPGEYYFELQPARGLAARLAG